MGTAKCLAMLRTQNLPSNISANPETPLRFCRYLCCQQHLFVVIDAACSLIASDASNNEMVDP